MKLISTKSYPRAALIGNPSDGYHGKTIAFVFNNFFAEVQIAESGKIEILRPSYDLSIYDDITSFEKSIRHAGYYGGERLIKATLMNFVSFCREQGNVLHNRNFSIKYDSNIPMRMGLAGSSAIVTATWRALAEFYGIDIAKEQLANRTLSVERDELAIMAGLQDRVAQAYEQPVFMDFNRSYFSEKGYGCYSPFNADLLPELYIAYHDADTEGSEMVHNDLKARFDQGNSHVKEAMVRLAAVTEKMYVRLKNGKADTLGELINENFEIRKSIVPIRKRDQQLIDLARSCGASAKFTGSGGAIIGYYENDEIYSALKMAFHEIGVRILKPQVVNHKCYENDRNQ